MTRWEAVPVDRDVSRTLAAAAGIPAAAASVLAGRGIDSPEAADRFLHPRLSDLSDPLALPDMGRAADAILGAIDGGKSLAIFGDYDADGVTSTALLVQVLRALGGRVEGCLPHRLDEGYGLSLKALDRCLATLRPDLIVTADCGTGSADAVHRAREAGVEVIVTDHHEVPAAMADTAVVNPKRGGPPETLWLSGVGVAFKLCHALVKRRRETGSRLPPALDLRDHLDLVAIGTVADIVPLTGENRILVYHGLARLPRSRRAGLAALLEAAGIRESVDAYHLGFVVGPRLNATGRLGSAEDSFRLLMTEDVAEARELAKRLESSNEERKRVEEAILKEADAEIAASFDPAQTGGIVVGREGWHVGTVGIVASRLCQRYRRPTVVIGFDGNGHGRGSGRSLDPVDIVKVLEECGSHLESYGGHRLAAGMAIRREQLEAFRTSFNRHCLAGEAGWDPSPCYRVDAWVRPNEVDRELCEAVRAMEPLGLGNPTPHFAMSGVRVMGKGRRVGRDHLKLTVSCGGSQFSAIGFGMAEREVPEGAMDLLFQARLNTYQGRTDVQLTLKDFRREQAV